MLQGRRVEGRSVDDDCGGDGWSSLGWWNLISLKIGRRCFEAKTNVPSAGTTTGGGGGGGGGQSG